MGRGKAQRLAMLGGIAVALAACGRGDDGADVAGVEVTAPPASSTIAPATTVPPPTTTQVNYVVQSGDSLSVIASRFGVSTQALADFNAITDANSIVVGQQLSIPPVTIASSTTTIAG